MSYEIRPIVQCVTCEFILQTLHMYDRISCNCDPGSGTRITAVGLDEFFHVVSEPSAFYVYMDTDYNVISPAWPLRGIHNEKQSKV